MPVHLFAVGALAALWLSAGFLRIRKAFGVSLSSPRWRNNNSIFSSAISSLFFLKIIFFKFSLTWMWKSAFIVAGGYLFYKDFVYFWEREERTAKEKHWCQRETRIICLSCTPYWGPGLKPRHVPRLGIKQATFRFAGWHSIHWATPARVWVGWIFSAD